MKQSFKKLNSFFSLLVMVMALGFISCSEDSTAPAVNKESQTLVEYIESTTDFINSSAHPGTIAATDVKTLLSANKAYVIDLRAAADFKAGHIPGAINVEMKNLIAHVKALDMTKYDKVVLVCYSGQNALFGGAFLRMMGYDKVASLAFGMAAWHEDFGKGSWPDKVSNAFATQLLTTASPAKNPMGNLPVINTGKTTGKDILEVRANEIINQGLSAGAVTATQVFQDPSKYYIVAYWPENHYLDPGHIPGSVNYIPKNDLKLATFMKTLPTDKPIVVYCYTGSGSAVISAYLRMLGYDAKTLLYGANSFCYDKMVGKTGFTTWGASKVMNYEYVKD